jgi:acylglycerol lipase
MSTPLAQPLASTKMRMDKINPKLRQMDGKFENTRQQKLFYCSFFPETTPKKPIKAVIVFVHGICEHSRRYLPLFDHLCRENYGVVAYDLISHGESDTDVGNHRVHYEKFKHCVDDTNTFIQFVKDTILPNMLGIHTKVSFIYFGQSYGTLVGLHTILSEKHSFHSVILSAPAVSVEYTLILRIQSLFAKPLSYFIPTARIVPGVNFELLSRNKHFIEDYRTDPLNYPCNLSARVGYETLLAMNQLNKDQRVTQNDSSFCSLPILFLQGSKDLVTSVPMATKFFNKIANQNKEFQYFEGFYHCLFNEPDNAQVFNKVINWLNTHGF